VFVLQTSPQPFDKGVVDGSTLAIHSQTDVVFVDYTFGKDLSSEVTPLVGVKELRECQLQFAIHLDTIQPSL